MYCSSHLYLLLCTAISLNIFCSDIFNDNGSISFSKVNMRQRELGEASNLSSEHHSQFSKDISLKLVNLKNFITVLNQYSEAGLLDHRINKQIKETKKIHKKFRTKYKKRRRYLKSYRKEVLNTYKIKHKYRSAKSTAEDIAEKFNAIKYQLQEEYNLEEFEAQLNLEKFCLRSLTAANFFPKTVSLSLDLLADFGLVLHYDQE